MARTGFYSDNANRYYPFLVGQGDGFVAKNVIVDCGFIMGPGSGYIAGTHSVWLGEIALAGGDYLFYFRSDAPGLNSRPLVFTRNLSDGAYTHEHTDNESGEGSISESSSVSCEALLWSGYLVTGDLSGLSIGNDRAIVEPANVRSLVNHYAQSINLANGDRTRFSVPDGCNPQCHTVPPQDVWVRQTCLQGPFRFQEGSNLAIRHDEARNALIFDAVVGGGSGESCEQVVAYANEVPPDNAATLDGAPRCDEVFRSINGQAGPNINVIGGDGVRVTADPANHKLVVNVDMNTLAVCANADDDFDYPSMSLSNPCACGEV